MDCSRRWGFSKLKDSFIIVGHCFKSTNCVLEQYKADNFKIFKTRKANLTRVCNSKETDINSNLIWSLRQQCLRRFLMFLLRISSGLGLNDLLKLQMNLLSLPNSLDYRPSTSCVIPTSQIITPKTNLNLLASLRDLVAYITVAPFSSLTIMLWMLVKLLCLYL